MNIFVVLQAIKTWTAVQIGQWHRYKVHAYVRTTRNCDANSFRFFLAKQLAKAEGHQLPPQAWPQIPRGGRNGGHQRSEAAAWLVATALLWSNRLLSHMWVWIDFIYVEAGGGGRRKYPCQKKHTYLVSHFLNVTSFVKSTLVKEYMAHGSGSIC